MQRYSLVLRSVSGGLLGWVLLLASGLFVFGPTAYDDSHITFSAAQNLADFGEVLNINGERTEQSSTLLQVLLL